MVRHPVYCLFLNAVSDSKRFILIWCNTKCCYKKGVLKIVTLDIEKRCFLKIRLESEEYNKNINLRFLLYTYTVQ